MAKIDVVINCKIEVTGECQRRLRQGDDVEFGRLEREMMEWLNPLHPTDLTIDVEGDDSTEK